MLLGANIYSFIQQACTSSGPILRLRATKENYSLGSLRSSPCSQFNLPTPHLFHHLLGASSGPHTYLCLYLLLSLDPKQLFQESVPRVFWLQSFSHTFLLCTQIVPTHEITERNQNLRSRKIHSSPIFPVAEDLPLVLGVWRGEKQQLNPLDFLPFIHSPIHSFIYLANCLLSTMSGPGPVLVSTAEMNNQRVHHSRHLH